MANEKIILDTNLWISFLISKKFNQLDKLIETNRITFIFSVELIQEFIDVASRSKFNRYFSKSDVNRILELINKYGRIIDVESDIKLCRDEQDNFLLNLAKDSGANFLITGDADLLELKEISSTKIVTFKEFIESF